MKCYCCQMVSINRVPCHETGCPNGNSRWDDESSSWIRQRKCFVCGYHCDEDDPCCDAMMDDYEMADYMDGIVEEVED